MSAGRRALKEAESRVPPDLRRQVDRRIKDADKTARVAIKALQTQVKRASTRADVNSVLKRIDALTRQARQIAGATGPARAASTRRRATTTTKRAAGATRKATTRAAGKAKRTATRTRKAATATTTRRRPAAKRATGGGATSSRGTSTSGRRTSAARRSSPRRSRAAEVTPSAPEMMIETEPVGEIEVFEITES